MFIALINPVMTVYTVRGGQRKGSKHICNFAQNIERIATVLPQQVQDVPLVVRRTGNDQTKHYDFIIRCRKVTDALEWLCQNHKWYRHIRIDYDRLSALPEDSNLEDEFVSNDADQAEVEPENVTGLVNDMQNLEFDNGSQMGIFYHILF